MSDRVREDGEARQRHQDAGDPVDQPAVDVADAADDEAERNAAEMKQRGRQHEAGRIGGAGRIDRHLAAVGVTVEHREHPTTPMAAASGAFSPSATTAPSTITEAAIPNSTNGTAIP